MARAQIITKTGTRITIEGDPQEVAAIVRQVQGVMPASAGRGRAAPGAVRRSARQRATPTNLIVSLIDGGFFRKAKDLGAVRIALAEMGHHYPVTTLSPVLLRFVRKRQLRRIKEKNRWLYRG